MEENKENKKSKRSKQSKPRADKYDEKVSFDGTFEELINISVQPKKEEKK